jgi:hypothetical protein
MYFCLDAIQQGTAALGKHKSHAGDITFKAYPARPPLAKFTISEQTRSLTKYGCSLLLYLNTLQRGLRHSLVEKGVTSGL